MALRKNLKITLDIKKIALFILGISAFILAYFTMQFTLSPERLRYSAPPPPPMPYVTTPELHVLEEAGGLREPCDASVAFGASKFCGAEPLMEVPSRNRRFLTDDPYVPPLVYPETQMSEPVVIKETSPVVVPINVRTNGMPAEYRQLGFLTRSSGPKTGDKMILPLMGRSLRNGRDKWQYYTLSNSPGTMQTRLPISVNGRSCTSEYGCDSISDGDVVYVDGYEETFRATLYETGLFSYLV